LAALQNARDEGATRVSLGSNTKLAPAIALYRSLGFTVVREGAHPEYARCNIVMALDL
jgi:ribosomal protein S18 acetylase RimI-like enzyme